MWLVALALWLALEGSAEVTAQQEGLPTLRVTVNVVNILCTVRDRNGRPVTNLEKEDFEVLEEGRPQVIQYFARQTDRPLTLGLLVDVSTSQQNLLEQEKRVAERFLARVLRKEDLAFLISFGPDVELVQDLTNSLPLLRAGLESLRIRGDVSSIYPGPMPPMGKPRGTVLMDAVYLAAREVLHKEAGRKAIIVLSDGVDIGSRVKLTEAIEAAQKADVVVYCVHMVDPRAYGFPAYGVAAGESDMRRMAEETGGRLFRLEKRNPLDKIFEQIEEELRSQYSLGYAIAEDAPPGSYRRIEVRVKRPGLRVQARKGYYVPIAER